MTGSLHPGTWRLQVWKLGSSRQPRTSRKLVRELGYSGDGEGSLTRHRHQGPAAGGTPGPRAGKQRSEGAADAGAPRRPRGAPRTGRSSGLGTLEKHEHSAWKVSAGRGALEGVSDHSNTLTV